MSELPPPTREVAHLVALIGPEATLALVERWGGTRLYLPKSSGSDSELWAVVGADAARYLSERYGREQIEVPGARQWRILVYRGRGMSHAQIARATGCTERTVRRFLGRAAEVEQQLDFFQF